MSTIITGDDTEVSITLRDPAGVVVNLSTASEIQARLVTLDSSGYLTPVYDCDLLHANADLANGVVVVEVVGTDTKARVNGSAKWEVQVIIDAKKTTYLGTETVSIIKGWVP